MVVEKQNATSKPICGVIMPISAIDDCSADHWGDVLSILREVIESANFEPNLVSDADASRSSIRDERTRFKYPYK